MSTEAREIAARIKVDPRDVRRGFRQAQGEAQQFGRRMEVVGARIKRAWQDLGFGRAASRFRALASTVGGFVGAYGIAQGIRRVREFEDKLGDMIIQAGKSNDVMDVTRDKILKSASDWGHMKDEMMSFTQTLVGFTGDLDQAVALMDKMGMVATGTGASLESLGGTVWQLQKNLQIKGPEQMLKAMAILRGMESVGPFQFKHFAEQGGRVFGQMGRFGKFGTGERGVRAAGGLLELAMPGVGGNVAMAATASETFLKQLFLKRKEISKIIGANVLGRALPDVFKDIGRAMQEKKKASKLIPLFAEGQKVAGQLATAYRGGWGAEAGKFFDVKSADIAKQATQRMEQPAYKWKKIMAELDTSMHRFFLPVMHRLVDLMPRIAKGIEWAMNNAKALLQTFLAIKAAGILGRLSNFLKTLSGTSVAGVGAVTGVGGIGAGVPGVGIPKTRAGAVMKGVGYAPIIGQATLGLLEGMNWLNRATGGPEASLWQTTQFDPELKRPGVGPAFERFRIERQANIEKQTEAGMSSMLSNLGVSKAQQRRGKELTYLKGKNATIAAKRLSELIASKREMDKAYKSRKMPPEQAKAYQDLQAMIITVKTVLERFDEKKFNVNVNMESNEPKNRSKGRSNITR